MSFDPVFDRRFENIIKPAIESLSIDGENLQSHRVDVSQTGDSILTAIIDGVANSRLVLADVSTIGRDSKTGLGFRNANVLYEVGLALACRQPSDVLLVRDDRDPFLFDVSAIPHSTIDFTDESSAISELTRLLQSRLNEQQLQDDARVEILFRKLAVGDLYILIPMAEVTGVAHSLTDKSRVKSEPAFVRLLEYGVIELHGKSEAGDPSYVLTPLGRQVGERAMKLFGKLHCGSPPQKNNACLIDQLSGKADIRPR